MVVVAAVVVGVALGALGAWLVLRARIAAETARLEAQLERERAGAAAVEQARKELETSFRALSAEALQSNNAAFLQLAETKIQHYVAPLKESLEKVDGQVRTLEQAREQSFGALRAELVTLRNEQERLRTATGNLATALRAPHVRGRWGEMQLRRVVEAAGLLEHCDFVAQASVRDDDGGLLRPDLVVSLPGGKQVVVDSKVPLAAYLDAYEAEDDVERVRLLGDHARQVRDHVAKLAAKAYWRQFTPAPDFVIMFVPDETFLRAAQEVDPGICEEAWKSGVVPASPTNLFALLRTVAATWQQETVAASAREVHGLGRELYDRLGTMAQHVAKLGRSLEGAVGAYNDAVGSLESRVLVTARKFEQHGIPGQLAELAPVERTTRALQAVELTAAPEHDAGRELPPSANAA
ncbi:MAG TPA: DNA recombination protein RmuC [Gaiellaceae bacterium]|nr:DNA recombination protein RmuC [Gaiellaceae bacterium]